MLSQVPEAMSKLARNVVLRHPNNLPCQVFRKVVKRMASESMGGLPELGGMGVLDSEDEEEYEFEFVGHGFYLATSPSMAGVMNDQQDGNIGEAPHYALIEYQEEPFFIRSHDVVLLSIGVARVAYEVVGIEAVTNIPPYAQKYVLNRRDWLDCFEVS